MKNKMTILEKTIIAMQIFITLFWVSLIVFFIALLIWAANTFIL